MSRPRRVAPRPNGPGAAPRIVVVSNKSGGGGGPFVVALLAMAVGGMGWYGYQSSKKGAPQLAKNTPEVVDVPKDSSADKGGKKPSLLDEESKGGKGMKFIPAAERESVKEASDDHSSTPYGSKTQPTSRSKDELSFDNSPEGLIANQTSREIRQEEKLAVLGTEATKKTVKERDAAILAKVVKDGAWAGYRDLLGSSLNTHVMDMVGKEGRGKFDNFWNEPVYYQDFLRWQMLTKFSPSDIGFSDKHKDLMGWLLTSNAAMEEILLTLKPADSRARVFQMLADYKAAEPAQFEKYFNLALACSVVFDQTVSIPAASTNPDFPSSVDPMKRFRWYIEKNEKGKLLASIEKSDARDLVWVVCAPVPESELDWAIDKLHLSRKGWGAAYGKVEYLMERAVNGLNPYESYTLAEILKKGGICGDQSYFCVNTARAHGLPAMTIAGETDLGGHAWAGVKIRDDEWSTMVGRIGGAANGEADNPQTGARLSEQEIWLWNDRAQQSALTVRSVFRHLWLSELLYFVDQPKLAEETIRMANTLGKPFSETWVQLYEILEMNTKAAEDPASPEILNAWVEFVSSMRGEFRENPRMAALASKAEAEFIFPNISGEDARKALARERRRIERNSGEQKDLIAASIKQEADIIKERGGATSFEDISNLYTKGLRAYGGSITGFKQMAEDYFSFVGDDQVVARKAAREIELAFKRVVETGSKDWFRANTETSIYKMICGYYRKAGDESRAERLEKDYKRLLKDAERGAL